MLLSLELRKGLRSFCLRHSQALPPVEQLRMPPPGGLAVQDISIGLPTLVVGGKSWIVVWIVAEPAGLAPVNLDYLSNGVLVAA